MALVVLLAGMEAGAGGKAAFADHRAAHPPEVSARAAALIDVESGRILYSKNGDTPMLIASLTKIMTAIVAIEQGNLADMVKVSRRAYGKEGSSLYLRLGEEMTLENMLYGLMLRSGNDAAVAIAEHIGGTEEGFVFLMNRKAEELGLHNTQFRNPHGLDADGHFSTANDLAKLTAYALKHPVFREIVRTETKTAPNPNEPWDYRWRNKNKMLRLYEGADGVKTGYTRAAGRSLVSSATRNGQQLAAVTINAPNDWADHARLLDYGFQHFPLMTVLEKGEEVRDTGWVVSDAFRYPLSEEERERLEVRHRSLDPDSVDYRLGVRGKLSILLEGRAIGVVDMVEPDSPRLKWSTAAFRPTEHAAKPPFPSRLTAAFRQVVRTMFGGDGAWST